MNRTGSSSSRVPPADTTTRRPVRSGRKPSRPRASSRMAVSNSSAGSGNRPGPLSAPVSRPVAGSRTTAPRSRSAATLARVAGCSHISVCMAGANMTGQRAVSSVVVSKSAASPCAALARRSAVAGATTTRSACRPISTCGTSWESAQTSVVAGWPESAAQVAAPTKLSESGVGMTRTWWPDSVKRRSRSQTLYAAMPAPTPRTMCAGSLPGWGSGGSAPRAGTSGLDGLCGEQLLTDLPQGHGKRLLLYVSLDQRPHVLEQTLTKLCVVSVDLPRPLRGHDDQLVLAVHNGQQLVDRRVRDAFCGGSPCHLLPSVKIHRG